MTKIDEAIAEKVPKRALGRGLASLIPSAAPVGSVAVADSPEKDLVYISLTKIALNPFQPRQSFEAEHLEDLTQSIRQHGVLQPIVVRRKKGGSFELVAGERRFRAASQAGLKEIPAVIRDLDDKSSLAIALIENIQREELNPIESARAYQRLLVEFELTQAELAAEVGKSQSAIANSIRFLGLPEAIADSLGSGGITEGHAKVILSLSEEEQRLLLWREILLAGLSVRESEKRAVEMKRNIPRGIIQERSAAGKTKIEPELKRLEEHLALLYGTKVRLKFTNEEKGTVEIAFYEREQLEGLLEKLAR